MQKEAHRYASIRKYVYINQMEISTKNLKNNI